jgi:hypothetical protein
LRASARCNAESRCAKVYKELTGRFERVETTVDLESVMREIDAARLEKAAGDCDCWNASNRCETSFLVGVS